jgi:nitrogen-specific signal transduction histidine kinase
MWIDHLLEAMPQSVVMIEDGQVKYVNDQFRMFVQSNRRSFGVTRRNQESDIDNILNFNFLKEKKISKPVMK